MSSTTTSAQIGEAGEPGSPDQGTPVTPVLGDGDLVDAIARGERYAVMEVYDRHGAATYTVACRLCEPIGAGEVVDEVLIGLWQPPPDDPPDRGSLRRFLLTQARRRAIRALRRTGARPHGNPDHLLPLIVAADEVVGPALDRAVGGVVARGLAELPDGERDAVALAYFGGHTPDEAATLLDQPDWNLAPDGG